MDSPTPFAETPPPLSAQPPSFRSGATARMAGMPVATLRIWEQRYRAVQPTTAPSGHRLYSVTDVERVTLMRHLTQQGHAIGMLAGLEIGQLRELLRAQPRRDANATEAVHLRLVVVGQAIGLRVQRLWASPPALKAPQAVTYFDTLADAVRAAPSETDAGADLLLWQAQSLLTGTATELRQAQVAWRAPTAAVTYRYASAPARAELLSAGAIVALEPATDESLRQWLASLEALAGQTRSMGLNPWAQGMLDGAASAVSPPRFSDAALTDFAGLSSGIACECPSHLAGLIQQINHFENYSGSCANRSPADAQMHAYLQRVAGAARMLFETALERVAVAEGLPLPLKPPPGTST